MQQVLESQNHIEAPINENFETLAYASVYGKRQPTTTGLTWGYYGGRWGGISVADGTLTLANNATNYVVVNRTTGAISVSSTNTNWNDTANYARVYLLTTAGGVVTATEDHRAGENGVGGGGSGGGSGITALTGDVTASGSGSVAATIPTSVISTFMRTVTDDANAAAARTTLGLAIGTDVQAYDADLAALAAIAGVHGDVIYHNGTSWVRLAAGTAGQVLRTAGAGANPAWGNPLESIKFACSDETTPLTVGTAKFTFRMPYAFTVTEVRASLTAAQGSGSIFTVDINEGGTSILSTKLTIDNTEETSVTAATPAVISDSSLADDAKITVDIDQIGNGTAAGLKVQIIGRRT